MKRSPKDYAKAKRDIAKAAKPLGDFIVGKLHGGKAPTTPPSVSTAEAKGPKPSAGKGVDKGAIRSHTREAVVLRDCLGWLHKQGIFAYRQNSGTAWIGGQPVSFGLPGAADITGILPDGRRLEVECKSATGRQSEKQKRFQQRIEENRGVYLLVRSVEELEAGLRSIRNG